jgi:sarcosine oxidase
MAGLHFGDHVDPDTVDREPSARDEERVRAWLRRRMPLADGERRRAQVCMYTNSPDSHFIIDRDGPVAYASACSGHGFKFASAVGEILADLTISGRSSLDVGFLSAARLAAAPRRT